MLSDGHANAWFEGEGVTTDRGTIGGVAGGVGLDDAYSLVYRVGGRCTSHAFCFGGT